MRFTIIEMVIARSTVVSLAAPISLKNKCPYRLCINIIRTGLMTEELRGNAETAKALIAERK